MTDVDICIRNARLRHDSSVPVDITIADGLIAGIGPSLDAAAREEIDAGGNLVTESFVNPHLHLCKVWTLQMMAEDALTSYHAEGMANSLSAIDLASKIKEKYDASWIIPNARRAVALAALHGNLHIRAFADVDRKARLEGVKALLAVREEFRGIVDLQVVAFAQDGLAREPGADRLMEEAMALGADVVGGIPWIEASADDALAHVEFCFDLAEKFGKDVSMLLDDVGDPNMRTLEMMATEAIRRKPYSVLLLDEVEKAHPDVFNVLLQVLDDGRLTDGQGRTVDFRNTVIIMTSNLGSQIIQEYAGEKNYAKMKSAVMEVVQQSFRPEFINRIDDIVVFHPLGTRQIRAIVDIQLLYLRKRLAERNMDLTLDDAARDLLGEAGFDPVYGARPLKRAIQQQIENPLAQKILQGEFVPGDRIRIAAHEGQLTFSRMDERKAGRG